ncbi:MAG: hypothetical protein OXG13_07205 [Gemmatimonadaceae bacterium]|nr:hypothetical protein [Gemmatimonadaceae bacterium]
MPSYDWIDLEAPDSYDRLTQVLDLEFDPKGTAESLKSQVTEAARGVLLEHGYVDKDYRSTFYNFYAKKGRQYRTDCVRLHFFDGSVRFDETRTDIVSNDSRPQDHYFGYIVLRPTIIATLGRSVLSPNIRRGARGRAIQSVHYVNLLGHRLPVWGFPSMAQHVDIAVCAHVSCWAILRYYSETFPQHREYLVHDITKLAAPFDPGGLVPSLGFNVLEAERVFQAAGCLPLLVGKRNSTSEAAFFSQLLAYLESGFPLFVAMPTENHAVVVVGYNWRQSAAPPGPASSHVWPQVETLLTVDDNLLPYGTVPLHSAGTAPGSPSYTAESFEAFIVALPDKIYYPADAIEAFSRRVEEWLTRSLRSGQEPIELRRYFITTVSRLREHARENHTHLGDILVGLLMRLETAQFVWVVEYCSVAQWTEGRVGARAIVDATASPRDPVPLWLLHDEDVAHVFDRSSAEKRISSIQLDRGGLGPLPRVELNLRPVVQSASLSAEPADPGGDE